MLLDICFLTFNLLHPIFQREVHGSLAAICGQQLGGVGAVVSAQQYHPGGRGPAAVPVPRHLRGVALDPGARGEGDTATLEVRAELETGLDQSFP